MTARTQHTFIRHLRNGRFKRKHLTVHSWIGFLATLAAMCATSVRGESTHGTWISGAVSGAIDTNKVFSVQLSEENRFGEKSLDEVHAIIGLGIKPLDWLSFTPHYHSVYVRKNATGYAKASGHHLNHRWEREDRTGIDVTPSYELRGWKFSDRNRVVWRNYEDSRGFWRYRNRIQVNAPWKWTDWKINPYASWELFLDDGKAAKDVRKNDKFDQWRFISGVSARLTKNVSLNVYYLLQEKKDTGDHNWSGNHVVGINLGFKF